MDRRGVPMANDASLTYVVSADKDGAEPPRSPASRLLRSAAIIGSYSLRAQGVAEIGEECHTTHPCRSRLAGELVVSANKDGADPTRSPASRLLRSAAIIGCYSLRAQGVDELAESAMRRIPVGAGSLANRWCQPLEMAQTQRVRQSMETAQSQHVRQQAGSYRQNQVLQRALPRQRSASVPERGQRSHQASFIDSIHRVPGKPERCHA
jgi:hypothetical protein